MKFHTLLTTVLLLIPWTALRAAPPATQPSATHPKIVLVGDSTVQDSSGWGTGFKKMLAPEATCINWAKGGRSSKSFINEGHWKKALEEKPDYVLIQFGHNDQPGKGPDRETDPATTYPQWMSRYVDEARAAGAKPVLVTSLTRRNFDKDGKIRSDLGPYVEAVKKLAAEKKVPLIDLYGRSVELCNRIGLEGAKEFDAARKLKPGEQPGRDSTHLNEKGAEVMGKILAEELKKAVPELASFVRG
jgi:pectinesterase